MKRLLITGGAGFIGSNFIRHILNKYGDYHVTNVDKLTYCGNLENLKYIAGNKNYEFVKFNYIYIIYGIKTQNNLGKYGSHAKYPWWIQ